MKKLLSIALCVALAIPFFNSCKKGEEDPFLSLKSRKGRLAGEWTVTTYDETSKSTSTYEDDANNDGELIKSVSEETVSFDGSSISMTGKTTRTYDGQGYNGKTSEVSEYSATGATYTETSTTVNSSGTTTETNTGTYTSSATMTYTFEKDGTFTAKRTFNQSTAYTRNETAYDYTNTNEDATEEEITGTWSFLGGNKSEEYADKERIALWFNETKTKETNKEIDDYTDKDANDWWNYNDDDETYESTDNGTYTSDDTEPDEIWQIVMLKSKEMKVISSYNTTNTGTYTSSNSYTSGGSTVTNTDTDTYNYAEEGTTEMSLTQE
ncbi:MAG: hypothetical protein C0594_10950 [Marinilabiliales bacterium]|nr:MAG: hypothetical protein C0594_10950 [Marinilabiliales bacterium]